MLKDLLERFNLLGNSGVTDVAFIVGLVFAIILGFPIVVEYANWIVGICAIICFSWSSIKAYIWPDHES